MNRIRPIRRLVVALVGLAGALAALATATPAALASIPPPPQVPPGWNKHPPLPPSHIHQAGVPAHTAISVGMPGWQIALIAVGAALFAATAAVLLDRARAARRKPVTSAA
jgi:hypothetical protein